MIVSIPLNLIRSQTECTGKDESQIKGTKYCSYKDRSIALASLFFSIGSIEWRWRGDVRDGNRGKGEEIEKRENMYSIYYTPIVGHLLDGIEGRPKACRS